jgi:hypothetical protein
MREFNNLRHNPVGGYDADIEVNGELVPYTLTADDIEATDVSKAKALSTAAKARITAQSIADEVIALESEITLRLLSNATRGEKYAVDKLAAINAAIAALGVRKE